MKIAYPTTACPALDFSAAAALAARLGFNGVELHALADPNIASATNVLLTSSEKIKRVFTDAHVAVASLNAGSAGSELADRIALAAELGCSSVRFECADLLSRSSGTSAKAVEWIRQCADQAASRQILLLIENQPIPRSAIAVWHRLDRIDHPAVACCWNTLSAFIAGDSPAVAVPTLNSRIQCVLLADGKTSQPAGPPLKVDLGTGEVPVQKTLDRLRGIGYQQCAIISPPMAGSVEDLDQSLQHSLETLRRWNILPGSDTHEGP